MKPQTEAAFTDTVLQFAKLHGWRTLHIRPARSVTGWRTPVQGDGKGFPDIVAVRGHRLLVAELKTDKGQFGPGQRAWLDAFAEVERITVAVWKPSDWEEITEVMGS